MHPSLEVVVSGNGSDLQMTGMKVFIRYHPRLRTAAVIKANDCCLGQVCTEVF